MSANNIKFSSEPQHLIPVRVSVARKQGDSVINGAHEVFLIDSDLSSRHLLEEHLQDKFRGVHHEQNRKNRVNMLDRTIWSPDCHVEYIKAIWNMERYLEGMPWASNSSNANETLVTDKNLQAVLKMLDKTHPGVSGLSVLIALRDRDDESVSGSKGY